MVALAPAARDEIKATAALADAGVRVTIAGYIRHCFTDGKWHGDSCGCPDDRCRGYHHDEHAECGCFEVVLREYVRAAHGRASATDGWSLPGWGDNLDGSETAGLR